MNILTINNLKVSFGSRVVVDDVSFSIKRHEVFGLVGESGSGKSMTALSLARLLPKTAAFSGEVIFSGSDIMKASDDQMRAIRGEQIAYVFQEPMSALNPVLTIGSQLIESYILHNKEDGASGRKAAREAAARRLSEVHIKDALRVLESYPHQLSGGMRQRVMIAMALMNAPELLILDEPTTALDVTIQSQILDLIEEVMKNDNVSALFISHDFGVISRMCDRIAVMEKGRIVESGVTGELLRMPREDYTKTLLGAVRALDR